jgi:hypothetical protein
MATMKLPGFTAEASLFTLVEYYRQIMAFRPTVLDGVVQPASCLSECVGDCLSDGHVHPGACIRFCRSMCRKSLD